MKVNINQPKGKTMTAEKILSETIDRVLSRKDFEKLAEQVQSHEPSEFDEEDWELRYYFTVGNNCFGGFYEKQNGKVTFFINCYEDERISGVEEFDEIPFDFKSFE